RDDAFFSAPCNVSPMFGSITMSGCKCAATSLSIAMPASSRLNGSRRRCYPHRTSSRRTDMVVKVERFQPAGLDIRMQEGKAAYSHVVTVTGPGKLIYTAGQLARDAGGKIVGPGDMRAQLEQTFKNLDACSRQPAPPGPMWSRPIPSSPTTKPSR